MSREVKLIVFGLILAFAFFNKHFNYKANSNDSNSKYSKNSVPTAEEKKVTERDRRSEIIEKYKTAKMAADYAEGELTKREKDSLASIELKDLIDLLQYEEEKNLTTIGNKNYVTYTPSNGFSPYDKYFGKGVYNNSADNTIYVKTPANRDIVFLLVDVYSKKVIRNEFIRAGTTFDLTGIPYGTYSFKYFSGNKWSDDYPVNNGKYKGGFTKNNSFSKSDKWSDNMTFERGYYGSYTLSLTEVVGGNLETESTTEDDFFN